MFVAKMRLASPWEIFARYSYKSISSRQEQLLTFNTVSNTEENCVGLVVTQVHELIEFIEGE